MQRRLYVLFMTLLSLALAGGAHHSWK